MQKLFVFFWVQSFYTIVGYIVVFVNTYIFHDVKTID